MRLLPDWFLTNKYPANYDKDSLTVIEQTARLYGAMQELIKEYNKFNEDIIKQFDEFKKSTNNDIEEFKLCVTQTMENYIKCIDNKVLMMDKHIEDYIKEVLNGEKVEVTGTYNPDTEELSLDIKFDDGGNT